MVNAARGHGPMESRCPCAGSEGTGSDGGSSRIFVVLRFDTAAVVAGAAANALSGSHVGWFESDNASFALCA